MDNLADHKDQGDLADVTDVFFRNQNPKTPKPQNPIDYRIYSVNLANQFLL